MSTMYGYIYKTTNTFNNKIYIGQHRAETFDPNYFGSGVILCNIINKYGVDNFQCEMLEECNSESELNEREIYWISYYNSTDYAVGYNLMSGGYKTRGIKHSDKTRQKISKSKTGCHPNRDYTCVSPDTRLKISNTLKEYYKNHRNAKYGTHLTDDTKEKLRQANLGKTYSQEVRDKHKRPAWNKGIPMTEDAKRHLSEINKGKKLSESTKEKLRGRIPWNKGNHISEDTRIKLRNANVGKLCTESKREKLRNRRWVSNGNTTVCIPLSQLDTYIENGYHLGRDGFNPHRKENL